MAGGGVSGMVIGIAHLIMTGAGFITILFRVFILMWIPVGGDTTESIIGMATGGTMNGYPTIDSNGTGRAGKVTDIGRGKEPGTSRAIILGHSNRCGN